MNITWILLYTLVTHGLEIVIFFKVDGIGLTFERIFKAFLFKILLAFVFLMIGYMVGDSFLFYFMQPLYGIGLSFLLLRGLPKKLLFFYGLFPMILVNLFYRGVSYFVLPFLGQVIVDKDSNPIFLLMKIFVCFIVLIFLKWLDYDFTNLRKEILDKGFQKSLTKINWIMGAYYLVMQSLSFFMPSLRIRGGGWIFSFRHSYLPCPTFLVCQVSQIFLSIRQWAVYLPV